MNVGIIRLMLFIMGVPWNHLPLCAPSLSSFKTHLNVDIFPHAFGTLDLSWPQTCTALLIACSSCLAFTVPHFTSSFVVLCWILQALWNRDQPSVLCFVKRKAPGAHSPHWLLFNDSESRYKAFKTSVENKWIFLPKVGTVTLEGLSGIWLLSPS